MGCHVLLLWWRFSYFFLLPKVEFLGGSIVPLLSQAHTDQSARRWFTREFVVARHAVCTSARLRAKYRKYPSLDVALPTAQRVCAAVLNHLYVVLACDCRHANGWSFSLFALSWQPSL